MRGGCLKKDECLSDKPVTAAKGISAAGTAAYLPASCSLLRLLLLLLSTILKHTLLSKTKVKTSATSPVGLYTSSTIGRGCSHERMQS
mmetsp:Transcript_42501/g.84127  ORF Transcript_42501/g.84127 Transcript_42501/m.84127 type:complete len:88 (-) Transcript_42501:239-502(-)